MLCESHNPCRERAGEQGAMEERRRAGMQSERDREEGGGDLAANA